MSKVAGWWADLPLAMVMLLFVIASFLYIAVNGFSDFHEPFVHSPWKALHLCTDLSVFQAGCVTRDTVVWGHNAHRTFQSPH